MVVTHPSSLKSKLFILGWCTGNFIQGEFQMLQSPGLIGMQTTWKKKYPGTVRFNLARRNTEQRTM